MLCCHHEIMIISCFSLLIVASCYRFFYYAAISWKVFWLFEPLCASVISQVLTRLSKDKYKTVIQSSIFHLVFYLCMTLFFALYFIEICLVNRSSLYKDWIISKVWTWSFRFCASVQEYSSLSTYAWGMNPSQLCSVILCCVE